MRLTRLAASSILLVSTSVLIKGHWIDMVQSKLRDVSFNDLLMKTHDFVPSLVMELVSISTPYKSSILTHCGQC